MKDIKFALVTEKRPNSFDPIYWSQKSLYNLNSIDEFTSNYEEEDFRNMLVKSYLLSDEDKNVPLQIIYNDNGIRKLKGGVFFKKDISGSMITYIQCFVKMNQNNANLLNNLLQKVNSDKLISDYSKNVITNIFSNRQLDSESLDKILNNLTESDYVDLRNIYYYIRKELEPKLAKKLVLSKSEDEN